MIDALGEPDASARECHALADALGSAEIQLTHQRGYFLSTFWITSAYASNVR